MKLKDITKINEWSEFAVVSLETMTPIPDDESQPASIEENVIVNHFGDIVLDHKLGNLPIPLSLEEFQYEKEGNLIETE